jgi:glycosyltransferase involved in cell wall biosynthesis
MKKLITVCLPTYNASKFIGSTLESLCNQTYKNIEILIGDNASTDNTYEIIKKYQEKDTRISYYKNEINLGYSENCNKLISQSKGEYIAIYHSDDVYDLTIVEKEVKALDENLDLAGVFTLANQIDEIGEKSEEMECPLDLKGEYLYKINIHEFIDNVLLKYGSPLICPTSMIRKKIYEEMGGYDLVLKYIEDQDMWARILNKYPLGIISEKLINYRKHESQGSSYYLDITRDDTSIILKHMEKFIEKNNYREKYAEKLNYSKAIDWMILSNYSIELNDYESFKKRTNQSKEYYKLPLKDKIGLIQNMSVKPLSYLIAKISFLLSDKD